MERSKGWQLSKVTEEDSSLAVCWLWREEGLPEGIFSLGPSRLKGSLANGQGETWEGHHFGSLSPPPPLSELQAHLRRRVGSRVQVFSRRRRRTSNRIIFILPAAAPTLTRVCQTTRLPITFSPGSKRALYVREQGERQTYIQ